MFRYTTPTITCALEGINISNVDVIRIALRGDALIVREFSPDDIDETMTATINLDQMETASLGVGTVDIQARVKYTDGTVQATNIESCRIWDVLDKVVM